MAPPHRLLRTASRSGALVEDVVDLQALAGVMRQRGQGDSNGLARVSTAASIRSASTPAVVRPGGNTLIVVTADHNHSMSIVGTHDRREEQGRAVNGVYADATYPTYVDTYGDRFPDDPNPEVPLFSAGPTTPTTPTTSRPTRCSPSRRCWTRAGGLQPGTRPGRRAADRQPALQPDQLRAAAGRRCLACEGTRG